MLNLLTVVPGKKRNTPSGWHTVNAVCCVHRGHRADTRRRGGILITDTTQNYKCFNCNFSCGFTLGKPIGHNLKLLLQWCGIDDSQIAKWSFESIQCRDIIDVYTQKKKRIGEYAFKEIPLPSGAIPIDPSREDHKRFIEYLARRGFGIHDYSFRITPNDDIIRNRNRIIIPYIHDRINVGHISRYLDNINPKYIKEQQPGFLFGLELQKKNWESCIVVEGVFDALSINGCALTTDTISSEQAETLNNMNKRIIVVPDQDKSGFTIINQALELGYQVSIPHWGNDVKDVNDAVLKFGKLPTLLSILQSATGSRVKIDMRLRHFGTKLSR